MLFADFNRLIANNEVKQFLLQVVEVNREAIPTQTTKKSVIDGVIAVSNVEIQKASNKLNIEYHWSQMMFAEILQTANSYFSLISLS